MHPLRSGGSCRASSLLCVGEALCLGSAGMAAYRQLLLLPECRHSCIFSNRLFYTLLLLTHLPVNVVHPCVHPLNLPSTHRLTCWQHIQPAPCCLASKQHWTQATHCRPATCWLRQRRRCWWGLWRHWSCAAASLLYTSLTLSATARVGAGLMGVLPW